MFLSFSFSLQSMFCKIKAHLITPFKKIARCSTRVCLAFSFSAIFLKKFPKFSLKYFQFFFRIFHQSKKKDFWKKFKKRESYKTYMILKDINFWSSTAKMFNGKGHPKLFVKNAWKNSSWTTVYKSCTAIFCPHLDKFSISSFTKKSEIKQHFKLLLM